MGKNYSKKVDQPLENVYKVCYNSSIGWYKGECITARTVNHSQQPCEKTERNKVDGTENLFS